MAGRGKGKLVDEAAPKGSTYREVILKKALGHGFVGTSTTGLLLAHFHVVQAGLCGICGTPMLLGPFSAAATYFGAYTASKEIILPTTKRAIHKIMSNVDHIVPIGKGGGNVLENTHGTHTWCNGEKGCGDIDDPSWFDPEEWWKNVGRYTTGGFMALIFGTVGLDVLAPIIFGVEESNNTEQFIASLDMNLA